MEVQTYASFVHILTLLLTSAIFLVIVLIMVKCIQSCAIKRGSWCNKRRRQACGTETGNDTTSNISSDWCSSSSESDTDSFNQCELNSINNQSAQYLNSAFYNSGYEADFDGLNEIQIIDEQNNKKEANFQKRNSIINRKYDDLSRFKRIQTPIRKSNRSSLCTVSSSVDNKRPSTSYILSILNNTSNQTVSEAVNKLTQLSINNIAKEKLNFNLTEQENNNAFELSINSNFNDISNNRLSICSNISKKSNINFDQEFDRLSIKADSEHDEIPPSYDQVVIDSHT